MRSCPPSPHWAAHEIFARLPSAYGSFARRLRRPVRPQGPADGAYFPRPCRDLHHTARRPAARLAAAGRLPILRRLSVPGAFLRVPQERPAKHQPDHYRRGEPGGQADQHPRPRAHPAPQADIPDTGRVPIHHTTSRADPLRPNAATGPRYVHAPAPRPVPTPTGSWAPGSTTPGPDGNRPGGESPRTPDPVG
jgi:hypothetical protein